MVIWILHNSSESFLYELYENWKINDVHRWLIRYIFLFYPLPNGILSKTNIYGDKGSQFI